MRIEIDFSNLERDHALGRPAKKSLSQLRRSASGLAAVSDRRGRGTRCDGSRMGDPVFARRVQRAPVGMMESGSSHRHNGNNPVALDLRVRTVVRAVVRA